MIKDLIDRVIDNSTLAWDVRNHLRQQLDNYLNTHPHMAKDVEAKLQDGAGMEYLQALANGWADPLGIFIKQHEEAAGNSQIKAEVETTPKVAITWEELKRGVESQMKLPDDAGTKDAKDAKEVSWGELMAGQKEAAERVLGEIQQRVEAQEKERAGKDVLEGVRREEEVMVPEELQEELQREPSQTKVLPQTKEAPFQELPQNRVLPQQEPSQTKVGSSSPNPVVEMFSGLSGWAPSSLSEAEHFMEIVAACMLHYPQALSKISPVIFTPAMQEEMEVLQARMKKYPNYSIEYGYTLRDLILLALQSTESPYTIRDELLTALWAWDELNNPERRKVIESRVSPIDPSALIYPGYVLQTVPIVPGVIEVTYRSISAKISSYCRAEATTHPEQLQRYHLNLLTAALHKISGTGLYEPKPVIITNTLDEAAFNEKREYLSNLTDSFLADLIINCSWFLKRVHNVLRGTDLKNS